MRTKPLLVPRSGSILTFAVVSLWLSAFLTTPLSAQSAKIKLDKLSDLPTFTYQISEKPSVLVQDPAKVLILAGQVQTNIKTILATYDIEDAPTLRGLYGTLNIIAVLQKDYPDAETSIAQIRGLEDKPSAKLTDGLVETALIQTTENPGADFSTTLSSNIDQELAPLPYPVVQDKLKETAGEFQILSPNFLIGQLSAELDPIASTGQLSGSFASAILGAAYDLEVVLPYRTVIAASFQKVVDANKTVEKPNIWDALDVTLPPSKKLHPVVIGIWDSGTDVSLFPGKLYVNPLANKDGYKDDVHGIAWTLHSDPSTSLLFPFNGNQAQIDAARQNLVGFEDIQSSIDSPDATAVKQKLATIPPAEIKPEIESIEEFANYAHGTHVTGIAVKGNPAARVLVCRITFDYHMIPELPTLAQANKDAAASVKQIAYFKAHGVRVVNMSWGGDLQSVEDALEANHAGGTPDQRKALARKLFYIGYNALYAAMKNASNILFVPAAGNGNNNVKFDEVMPSDFKLPNIINVGAVDQAGDQTSFTSFGNVDVYADGFQVPSTIPGGYIVKLSGTSMAAPEVTNLAAKILAIDPKLTPTEVKRLIVDNGDVKIQNGVTILLLDPKKTIAAIK